MCLQGLQWVWLHHKPCKTNVNEDKQASFYKLILYFSKASKVLLLLDSFKMVSHFLQFS